MGVIKIRSRRLEAVAAQREAAVKKAEAALEEAERNLLELADEGAPEDKMEEALRRLELAREMRRQAKAALLQPPPFRAVRILAAGSTAHQRYLEWRAQGKPGRFDFSPEADTAWEESRLGR